MKIDIYKDHMSYVTDEISSVRTEEANLNEENRIKFVTDLAAVSRGNSESKNPAVRYKALLKEAAPQLDKEGNKKDILNPSRPLEFLPIVLDIEIYKNEITLWNKYQDSVILPNDNVNAFSMLDILLLSRHSHFEENFSSGNETVYRCYTNMRALLNAGLPYDLVPYNSSEELKDFKAIKAMIPMFVWAQVPNTHTMISKEAQSDRVAKNDDYWLPEDFRQRVYDHVQELKGKLDRNELQGQDKLLAGVSKNEYDLLLRPSSMLGVITILRDRWSQTTVQGMFKELGYPQEIYSRALYYFKYKEVVMTGWNNDPKVWKHLFLERTAMPEVYKNWTQAQTKKFTQAIKTIIQGE